MRHRAPHGLQEGVRVLPLRWLDSPGSGRGESLAASASEIAFNLDDSTSSPGRKPKCSRSAWGMVTCPLGLTRLAAMICSPLCASCHLRQRRFRLGQPEGHVHGTVQVDGRGQGGVGLLISTGLVVQPAQPEVAVGHERAHAQLLGQGQGLLVVGFGRRDIGRDRRGPGRRQAGAARSASFPRSLCCRARSSAWRGVLPASSPCPARRQTSLSQASWRDCPSGGPCGAVR